MLNNKATYISLFSSAGVGCYGFKMEDFECVATNELIGRRLEVQKINKKCKFDTGYINGDITKDETKELIFNEIKKWKKLGNDGIDVLIATPPCQGMSVANHKKKGSDYNRNSLVVESIKMIKDIKPKFFIFENVSAFMSTVCESPKGGPKAIKDVITEELGKDYIFTSRILNFKNYGANSSRTRTIVIGVKKTISEFISPIELYPSYRKEKTIREVIGDLPELKWGEFDENDFYHQFRTYDIKMLPWIENTKQGKSAFDNEKPEHRPHKIEDGKYIANVNKNGDKYTRQLWDKVAPCIHTRNDQLASQNTIHPIRNSVFTIRELMIFMSIPKSFKWINKDLKDLNTLSLEEKKDLLKKNEINIRQSIGEAVPTEIFRQIAANIKYFLMHTNLSDKEIFSLIKDNELNKIEKLIDFIKKDSKYTIGTLSRIVELSNSLREDNEAYFTNKSILNDIYEQMPTIEKDIIDVLEPSVGIGNFIPYIIKKYEDKKINIDVCDIDEGIIECLKEIIKKYNFNNKITFNYIKDDYLLHNFDKKYDLVIGNPPFANAGKDKIKLYDMFETKETTKNLSSYFIEKSLKIGDYVIMIVPKNFLNTPEYKKTREMLNEKKINCILDFGENGFKGVLIETICFFLSNLEKRNKTLVVSPDKNYLIQKQSYITDDKLPYWLIYRNKEFDEIFNTMEFGIFNCFRDRQITNNNTFSLKKESSIRVLKSRNISDDGRKIIDIEDYDSYINEETLKELSVYKYKDRDDIYLTPNMTYNPRVCKMPKNTVVNGSIAILIPKDDTISLSDEDMLYFSSKEFRNFYRIARNFQTRSLNIDANSVFFFGKRLNN